MSPARAKEMQAQYELALALNTKLAAALAQATREAYDAQRWRNKAEEHARELRHAREGLKQIRRAAVALKRDTDPHAEREHLVECSKSALHVLFEVINSHTQEENAA